MPDRRLDISLDKVPGCGTVRRSSSHRQRRKHRGPSASADFDLNKENRMQDWLCPSSTSQQPTKAKRKLYCGKHSQAKRLLPAEDVFTCQMEAIHHQTQQSMNCIGAHRVHDCRSIMCLLWVLS